jgi:hypothetical protein
VVRVVVHLACDPIGDEPSTTELRRVFLDLLDSSPIRALVGMLTSVPDELSWQSYGGNGRWSLVSTPVEN